MRVTFPGMAGADFFPLVSDCRTIFPAADPVTGPLRCKPGSEIVHDSLANVFLLVYAGLFPIINPIGTAPIFLGLTAHCTDAERKALARGVAINSILLLAGSLFVGSYILEFFGITLPIVRVAGGIVVIAFGWKLLQSGVNLDTGDRTAKRTARERLNHSIH